MKPARGLRKQAAEAQALRALLDEQIDASGIPDATNWSSASRGEFHRPTKQQISLRLDADVIEWFKGKTASGRCWTMCAPKPRKVAE